MARGWKLSVLIECGEGLEEAEYLGLREDIWEDAEVYAELRKAFEVHLEFRVRIVRVEG